MESKYTRYLLIGLTVFCIAIIGITSFSDGLLAPLRTAVGYFLIPIQSGVNKVGITIYDELTDYASLKSALDENKKLQEEVAQLTEENNRLVSDQFELRRLRELYNLIRSIYSMRRQQPESLPRTLETGFRYSVWIKVQQMEWKWAAM